ncbi:hypothetical protein [Pengzhenrongella sicca]|uniref:Uncharacterized protein n=1 Tax=Pengzhenrongella sicca TaxID=2819238 RepID=A0A8A4ZBP4_9MICO|nr:hypothetical protein [Pengzhenrongella sicca]QTE28841.1 hypothetical protein J4E96_16125 [Pengzhenrongella sicca]
MQERLLRLSTSGHSDDVTVGEPGGRHHADRVPWPRRPAQVFGWKRKFVRSFVWRIALGVGLLGAAAAGGGVGVLAAPLIRQPREAGFWGGVVVVFVAYILLIAIVFIGNALRVPSLMRWRDRMELLA